MGFSQVHFEGLVTSTAGLEERLHNTSNRLDTVMLSTAPILRNDKGNEQAKGAITNARTELEDVTRRYADIAHELVDYVITTPPVLEVHAAPFTIRLSSPDMPAEDLGTLAQAFLLMYCKQKRVFAITTPYYSDLEISRGGLIGTIRGEKNGVFKMPDQVWAYGNALVVVNKKLFLGYFTGNNEPRNDLRNNGYKQVFRLIDKMAKRLPGLSVVYNYQPPGQVSVSPAPA